MTDFPETWAVVLAAGRAKRLGGGKLLLPLGGCPVVMHVLAAYRAAGDIPVVAVIRPEADALARLLHSSGARVVVNPHPERGMYSSLCVGVAALPATTGAFFVHPADIPLVTPATLSELRVRLCANPERAVAVPTFLGRRGHPPLLAGRLISTVLAGAGQDGLRGVLQGFREQTELVECDDAGVLLDMDTPDDYRALQQLVTGMPVTCAAACAG